jgi:hypothetical protein
LRQYATSWKIAGSISDEDIGISSRTMALGSNQSVTEMGTSNLLGGKEWPVYFTAICEPIVYKI